MMKTIGGGHRFGVVDFHFHLLLLRPIKINGGWQFSSGSRYERLPTTAATTTSGDLIEMKTDASDIVTAIRFRDKKANKANDFALLHGCFFNFTERNTHCGIQICFALHMTITARERFVR